MEQGIDLFCMWSNFQLVNWIIQFPILTVLLVVYFGQWMLWMLCMHLHGQKWWSTQNCEKTLFYYLHERLMQGPCRKTNKKFVVHWFQQMSSQLLGVNKLLGVTPKPRPTTFLLCLSMWALCETLVHMMKKVAFLNVHSLMS